MTFRVTTQTAAENDRITQSLREAAERIRPLQTGDRVRVAEAAWYGPTATGRAGISGETGYVDPEFFGQEGVVSSPNDDGTWYVTRDSGEGNYIHQNWLTRVGTAPRIRMGSYVQVSDPAYMRPNGTGAISPQWYGQVMRVRGRSTVSGAWRLTPRGGGMVIVAERYLTPEVTPAD